ncbi:MAG: hypothetical protein ACD_2C00212G0005 [uncultured bacterium (gcode 4)]|uniref:Uncharacterized protein n=1 Tax=uncultured bacterium (gcode 4) TaxID=1234023 RepID=K2H093_9BACT|nr:MAG: hypothetical protein ACD_2C00212G0005 [uncultured bacterium (gcode 4)]
MGFFFANWNVWDSDFRSETSPVAPVTGGKMRQSSRVEAISQSFRSNADEALRAMDSLISDSFESVVSSWESQLRRILSEVKRRLKYEKKNILVPRLTRMIDDDANIHNRWARLPFLEEKIVDNPDYEDVFALKSPVVRKEIKILTRSLDVELPPEPVWVQLRINDNYWSDYGSLEFRDDYSKHIQLFFRLVGFCKEILNEEIKINLICKSEEEAKINRELLKNLKIDAEMIFEEERSDSSILVFEVVRDLNMNFDLFSQKGNIAPFECQVTTIANKFKNVNMQDNLHKTKTTILEYLLGSLKRYYEF